MGSGIAGMACAWLLREHAKVTLFERENGFGGHTNTVGIREGGQTIPVDTGFMVYNEQTYPQLIDLFRGIGVSGVPTDMSFGVQDRTNGLAYACSGLKTYFAQWRRIIDPGHWRLLSEILRFFREATEAIKQSTLSEEQTLGAFLQQGGYSSRFREHFLLPMTGAIWSSRPEQMLKYPARFLLQFMHNHGLLGVGTQFQWYTFRGGSDVYKSKILEQARPERHLSTPVKCVRQDASTAVAQLENGQTRSFDAVLIAAHADEALKLLEHPSDQESALLGAFEYSKNRAILHDDRSVMPREKAAWASWNYCLESGDDGKRVTTHYWMNRLQPLETNVDYFVSLNEDRVAPERIHWQQDYTHPCFNAESMKAQEQLPVLNQSGPVYFCGSYFGNGFHEDAFVSAKSAVEQLLTNQRA